MSHQNHSYLIIENTMIVAIPERLVAEMSELPGVLDTEISWNSIEFYRILWDSMTFLQGCVEQLGHFWDQPLGSRRNQGMC